MKKFMLFAATMLLAVSVVSANECAKAATEVAESVEAVAQVGQSKVYSNCYDGYLNVRSTPSSKSQIVGKLKNGPEGAVLLGVEGSWSKVRVDGVVGYVASKYLQSTPTESVYVDASAVIGQWFGDCSGPLKINSNGTFEHTFGFSPTMSHTEGGTWHLVNDFIVLKYNNGDVVNCIVEGEVMISEEEETFSRTL